MKKKTQKGSKMMKTEKNNQKPETQAQDATNPQETGRSMTEMLGVLAVIGVLSIGGIQGYTYAMNKYRANEVVNELNLLNAQLAMFMNGIHETEAVMSLGEPYDNGEKINAGGYAFAYGCGQDPDSTSPCDLDETGYYMTLTGVPEEVCKSATQMTVNMMNLVEQKVNGYTDNDGVLCQDGENEIVLLFDANDGQGTENGEGGIDDDENDITEPYYPNETEPYEEETTTSTPETSVAETVSEYPCEDGYFYSSSTNSCYSCNEHKPYTDFTDLPQAISVNFHNGLFERCTNRYSDCGTAGMFCGSFLRECPNGYVLNKNSCHCSSQGIPVYVNGGSGSGNCTFDGAERGAPSNNACCEPEGYAETTLYEETTTTYFETTTTAPAGYECKDTTYECQTNSDCDSGYYCDITCYNDHCTKDTSDMGGSCRKASSDLSDKPASAPYWRSRRSMYWWSAKNFCEALGKTLVDVSDYGCVHSICPSGCDNYYGYCHATSSQSVLFGAKDDRAAKVQAMYDAYGNTYGWTNTDYSSCNAYYVTFGSGFVYTNDRNGYYYAVCK